MCWLGLIGLYQGDDESEPDEGESEGDDESEPEPEVVVCVCWLGLIGLYQGESEGDEGDEAELAEPYPYFQ